MNSKTKSLVILAAIFVLSPESLLAAAEETGHAGWGWLETIGRWFNLAILFGVIFHFSRTPLKQFLKHRRQSIQEKMQAAEKARQEAQAKLATIEARLQNLDTEIAQIREESQRQAESERARILELAVQEADKILALAKREILGMSLSARKDLQSYASGLALELAEKQIRKDLTANDDARMIDDFFNNLQEQPGGGQPS